MELWVGDYVQTRREIMSNYPILWIYLNIINYHDMPYK